MTFKSILALVAGSEADQAALDTALAVARRFDSHIEALHVRGDPADAMPLLGEGASGAMIEQIITAAQREWAARAERGRRTFDGWVNQHALTLAERAPSPGLVSVAWRDEAGSEDEVITAFGRVADLLVIARPADGGAVDSRVAFESALLGTGRPVLAAPPVLAAGLVDRMTNGPLLVAWNDSAEAAEAVAAALPLMATASAVKVVTVAEGGRVPASVGRLIDYLAWHGIAASGVSLAEEGKPVGAMLLDQAEASNAGFLVMGAYTHSRFREMVFGGVTQFVITHARVPVLMAH